VQIQDAGGNPVTDSTATITLTRTPGSGPGTLTCTDTALPAVRGVVAFAGCAIDRAGEGYTLTATAGTDPAVPPLTSDPVTITTGEPARLVFTASPQDGEAVTAVIPLATQ